MRIDTFFSRDPQAVGEACNPDGTLKDASENEWLHSPSDMDTNKSLKRIPDEEETEGDNESGSVGAAASGHPKPKRQKVSEATVTRMKDAS